MVKPPHLKYGEKVILVATARKILQKELKIAVELLKSWNLVPILGTTIGLEDDQYAGTDSQRIKDFQAALDNPEIKAIWCARGGYGTVRLIDHLNFYKFVKYPKWIAGYSDVTVLHSHIHKIGFQTLHSTMPVSLEDNTPQAIETLRKGLFGEKPDFTYPTANALNRKGKASGTLVGGNLSILYSLCGSTSSLDTEGKIFFIEDLDEYLYHIDRMMMNLKRNGMLDHCAGMVIGGMTKMHDNRIPFGKTAQEIVLDAIKDCNFPVAFDFPAGHVDDNRALILGSEVTLEVTATNASITYES